MKNDNRIAPGAEDTRRNEKRKQQDEEIHPTKVGGVSRRLIIWVTLENRAASVRYRERNPWRYAGNMPRSVAGADIKAKVVQPRRTSTWKSSKWARRDQTKRSPNPRDPAKHKRRRVPSLLRKTRNVHAEMDMERKHIFCVARGNAISKLSSRMKLCEKLTGYSGGIVETIHRKSEHFRRFLMILTQTSSYLFSLYILSFSFPFPFSFLCLRFKKIALPKRNDVVSMVGSCENYFKRVIRQGTRLWRHNSR